MASLRKLLGRRNWTEWIVFLVLLAGSAALGNYLSSGTSWITLRGKIYQGLTAFGRNGRTPQRTAVVLLDDTDYWTHTATDPRMPELAARAPTNRIYLARMIDTLAAAHVGLIVLDIDLRSPSSRDSEVDLPEYADEDEILFRSIRDACAKNHQVVLASELISDGDGLHLARTIYDRAGFPGSCVHPGYIELPLDIRRVPSTVTLTSGVEVDSLSLAAVKANDLNAYKVASATEERDFPYSEFLPLTQFKTDSADQTLFSGREIDPKNVDELSGKLLNRIVLIGANWHTLAFDQGTFADRHPTPSGELPGVILHANYIEAALQGGIHNAFPESIGIALEVLLVLALSLLGMLELHWAWKWGAVLLSCVGVVIFCYLLLRTFGLMLDFFFPLIFLGLHSGYEHLHEWRHSAAKD
jgi:CHASE2 domain-containing sensor protein